ncbi:MAG: succinate dehydrogenase [Proteobacteria bacterium]|nr:succinate dehydrogenase [Pseudomonadota bacterium]
MPRGPQPDSLHRRPQASNHARLYSRRDRVNVRLYLLQRATALLMAPLVIGHVIVIFYATRHGLSAAEILGRTRGSLGFGLYYASFVLAAAMHGAIGIRSVAHEWAGLSGRKLDLAMWAVGLGLAALGLRAVYAVVLA